METHSNILQLSTTLLFKAVESTEPPTDAEWIYLLTHIFWTRTAITNYLIQYEVYRDTGFQLTQGAGKHCKF